MVKVIGIRGMVIGGFVRRKSEVGRLKFKVAMWQGVVKVIGIRGLVIGGFVRRKSEVGRQKFKVAV